MADKKEKIREIFAAISSDRKENVRRKLAKKFSITVDSAKFNWIYAGKIPDQHVDEVLSIVKTEAKDQSDSILELIS